MAFSGMKQTRQINLSGTVSYGICQVCFKAPATERHEYQNLFDGPGTSNICVCNRCHEKIHKREL